MSNDDSSTSDTPQSGETAGEAVPKKRKARIEHKTPGRIRMKIPHAKEDPTLLDVYCEAFGLIPGVTKVKAKPETGSIVIHYDHDERPDFEHHLHHHCSEHLTFGATPRPHDEIHDMADKIRTEAEFLAERSEIARVTVDFFRKFDQELKIATDNTVDLTIALAAGLAAFTFLEIGASAATPMWVTLALFSVNHIAELHVGAVGAGPSRTQQRE